MCIGGNNADHTSFYVNAQLAALHGIATECVAHYDVEGTDKFAEAFSGYDIALAEFRQKIPASKTSNVSYVFEATFGVPRIEFACAHEVILYLAVTYASLTTGTGGSVKGGSTGLVITGKPKPLEEVVLAVRLPFETFTLQGESGAIGNAGRHNIAAYVLDYTKARFVEIPRKGERSEINLPEPQFVRPLIDYLDLLRRSGHHVFSSFPDFDDNRHTRLVDFTDALQDVYVKHFEGLFNIQLESITKYIQEAWLAAAWEANGTIDITNRGGVALAEWKSTWTSGATTAHNFHILFDVPKIEIICPQEALFWINVDEIVFSKHPEFKGDTKLFKGWKLAIAVKVVHHVNEDGTVTTLRIDVTEDAKFLQLRSDLPGFNFEDNDDCDRLTVLLDFILRDYFPTLERAGFSLYHFDSRTIRSDKPWIPQSGEAGSASELINNTDMQSFQHIIALSRHSVNEIYKTYWEKNIRLQEEKTDPQFNATYAPLAVRLLSEEQAIVWVHLKTGSLQVPAHTGEKGFHPEHHSVSGWKVAFLVPFVISTLPPKSDESEKSPAGKIVVVASKTRQISLDFANAQFLLKQTVFPEGSFTYSREVVDKVITVRDCIINYYFGQIRSTGSDIVYSIPLDQSTGKDRPHYAFWDVHFHVYSKVKTVDLSNFDTLQEGEEPVIIVLGTVDREITKTFIEYSSSWLHRVAVHRSFGTMALSRDIFLERRLLPLLSNINGRTTLVPKSIDFADGRWNAEFIMWDDHKIKGHLDRSWIPADSGNASFEYTWQNLDEFEYHHESKENGEKDIRHHTLVLQTKNHLTIPTTFRENRLDIVMKGETSLQMGWKTESETIQTQASVTWAIVLSAITDANGLRLEINTVRKPEFKEHKSGRSIENPLEHIKAQFTNEDIINPATAVSDLKTLQGPWTWLYPGVGKYKLANPFFSNKGDILFDLLPNDFDITAVEEYGDRSPAPAARPRFNRHASGMRTVSAPPAKGPTPTPAQPPKTIGNGSDLGHGLPSVFVGIDTKSGAAPTNGDARKGVSAGEPIPVKPISVAPPAAPAVHLIPQGRVI